MCLHLLGGGVLTQSESVEAPGDIALLSVVADTEERTNALVHIMGGPQTVDLSRNSLKTERIMAALALDSRRCHSSHLISYFSLNSFSPPTSKPEGGFAPAYSPVGR